MEEMAEYITEMEEMVVWLYSAALPMESLGIIMAREETVVLLWDKVLWLTVKMDTAVD
jgi:hypothetical protein